ncbi:MAG: spondin domain-containing protein [Proteobacteria bacterium]|nr:spondin domain-containing protein [Pseudomonadota bacterium]
MRIQNATLYRLFGLIVGSMFLHACDSNSAVAVPPPPPPPPPPAMASFDITVSNLTNAQPLSPIAVIGHRAGYTVFTIGDAANPGLEEMAEGGDNTALLAEAAADAAVVVTGSGAAPIGPAGSETVTINLLDSERQGLLLSVGTMLVNTNDAFSGLSSAAIGAMAVGDISSFDGVAYDAGTESDSESAIHIPGPAGGGEGFNSARDDQVDRVAMHAGIVSQNDGLATSDLTEQHRFDNPVLRVRIERTQ